MSNAATIFEGGAQDPHRSNASPLAGAAMPQLKEARETPLYLRPDEMWPALGVADLRAAIGVDEPLGILAQRHLEEHPFDSFAARVKPESVLWYEGSYDPIGVHHFNIFCDTIRRLGFRRAALAIVYKHPVKSMSPYEHRYEMAKGVLQKAGFTVVDDIDKDGVCLFPPNNDGLNRFHVARLEALYGPKNFVLIGPDNFDRAIETNIVWTHIDGVKSSISGRQRYGFRSMYEDGIVGLKDRIVVYPALNSVHSTNIRNGEVPMLGPVRDYVTRHGLYQSSGGPKGAAPAATNPATPKSTPTPQLRDCSIASIEMRMRKELLDKVKLGFPWSFDETRASYQAALGAADQSELAELLAVILKCDRRGDRGRQVPKYYFEKRASLATKLLRVMADATIGGDIQITGAQHVSAALQRDHDGAHLLFVANESGWGDVPLLTHALKESRMGSVAKTLTYVYGRDVFKTPTHSALVGHAANILKPTSCVREEPLEVQQSLFRKALRGGLAELRHGGVVLFPESQSSHRADFELSNVGPEVVGAISSYVNENGDPEFSAQKVFVIPVGMVGGSYLDADRLSRPFSTDYPAVVRFGEALRLDKIVSIATQHGDKVAGHVIGHRIAALLPTEWRGAYATGASESEDQELAREVAEALKAE